jgi:hypothetical protein
VDRLVTFGVFAHGILLVPTSTVLADQESMPVTVSLGKYFPARWRFVPACAG